MTIASQRTVDPDPVIDLRPAQVLYEGVPAHVEHPLRDWLRQQLTTSQGYFDDVTAQKVCLEAELLPIGKWHEGGRYRAGAAGAPRERLLLTVNAYLKVTRDKRYAPTGLEDILVRGGSAYRFDEAGRCLVRRVDPSAQALKDYVVTTADPTAAALLQQAWEQCYGLSPAPDEVYASTVKAVEQVLCPLVSANNPQPTLFKTRDTLLKDPSIWELAIPDPVARKAGDPMPDSSAQRIIALVDLLCAGHVSRHSANAGYRPQTQAEAEAALTIAITVVQLVTAGSFRKR